MTKTILALLVTTTIGTSIGLVAVQVPVMANDRAILLQDNFDAENAGIPDINYTNFTNWDITGGAVDLIGNEFFDFFPGNGVYLDLDGSSTLGGRLESKNAFAFNPGDSIWLEFDLAGNQRFGVDSVNVSLGSLFSETFALPTFAPFRTISRNITVNALASAELVFDHSGSSDFVGLLLDNVNDAGGAIACDVRT